MDELSRHLSPIDYEVRGRHGTLGVVVATTDSVSAGGEELVVRGGRSALLRYHVPAARVCGLSVEGHTVDVDVDVADFAPRVGRDGSVDLHLRS